MAETKENSRKEKASTPAIVDLMEEGMAAIVQVHNDWLDLISQQQHAFVQALRDGLGHYETLHKQGEKEYRKAFEAMTAQVEATSRRAASFMG